MQGYKSPKDALAVVGKLTLIYGFRSRNAEAKLLHLTTWKPMLYIVTKLA